MERLEERVYCRECKNKTYHEVLYIHEERNEPDFDFSWIEKFYIARCAGCHTVSFVKQYGDEDQWVYDFQGERVWKDDYKVFPEEPKQPEINLYEIQPKLFRHAPMSISKLYDEVIDVFNQGYLLLATVGIRTLIEAICLNIGIQEGHLFDENQEIKHNKKKEPILSKALEGKIFGLYENGFIIWEQALILQKIRDMGNAAVHEIKTPEISDFISAIQIIEQVLTNVYELKVHKFLNK